METISLIPNIQATGNGEQSDWCVMKFGGSSVAKVHHWRTIASLVRRKRQEGMKPLIVCSAVKGATNLLEKLPDAVAEGTSDQLFAELVTLHERLAGVMDIDVHHLLGNHFSHIENLLTLIRREGATPQYRAEMLSQGELMSTRLGAAYLQTLGVSASWQDARKMLRAEACHDSATMARDYLSCECDYSADPLTSQRLSSESADAWITQGFIASNVAGETVLLGRGGSDTSAAYFAAKLQARVLEIWTDVPGIFSANPGFVEQARLIKHVSYDEAEMLASKGAKVLHPRCVAPARDAGIAIDIKCTGAPDMEGTRIDSNICIHDPHVKAVISRDAVCLISASIRNHSEYSQLDLFRSFSDTLEKRSLVLDSMSTNSQEIQAAFDPVVNALNSEEATHIVREMGAYSEAQLESDAASVSLVGQELTAMMDQIGKALTPVSDQRFHGFGNDVSGSEYTFFLDKETHSELVHTLHSELIDGQREHGQQIFGGTWDDIQEEIRNVTHKRTSVKTEATKVVV